MRFGPLTLQDFCVNINPSTSSVSSTVPPNFLITFMFYKCNSVIKI